MSWHTGRLALFDLETTGVDPHRDRIVTAALVEVGAGVERLSRDWLLDPGIDIPEGATAVHGVSTAHAREQGHPASKAVWEIADAVLAVVALGQPVVGHNVTYDLTMLHAECLRHGHDGYADQLSRVRPVVDTLILDKWADPWRPKQPTKRRPDAARCGSRTLVDTCRIWGINLTEQDAHGAPADALAAGRLAYRLAQANPGLTEFTAAELHEWQVQTKREQADSFGAYLVKQGKPDDVSRDWPIQAPPGGWTPDQIPIPTKELEAVS